MRHPRLGLRRQRVAPKGPPERSAERLAESAWPETHNTAPAEYDGRAALAFHITERREAPPVTANTLNRRRGHHGAKN